MGDWSAWYYVFMYLFIYLPISLLGGRGLNQGIACIYKDVCIRCVRVLYSAALLPSPPFQEISCGEGERGKEITAPVCLPCLLTYLLPCLCPALLPYLLFSMDLLSQHPLPDLPPPPVLNRINIHSASKFCKRRERRARKKALSPPIVDLIYLFAPSSLFFFFNPLLLYRHCLHYHHHYHHHRDVR